MLTLAEGLLRETLTILRRCGDHRNECVVYWSGPLEQPDVVDAELHPAHQAGPDFYEVAPAWLNETWIELARARRTLRAQVHTHAGRAFHSRSDDGFPIVQQAGLLSLVLPHHAEREDLGGAYLCRLDDDGRWRELPVTQGLALA
jgi:hypothetical protein